jgi:hypothetical protein
MIKEINIIEKTKDQIESTLIDLEENSLGFETIFR